IIDSRDALRTFSSLAHEEKIKAFREMDGTLSDLAVEYIRAKVSGEIPDEDDDNRHPGYGVLGRELQKRKRHMPVRKLVEEMESALTTLTPCLLMSPLSISQFLSADNQLFDLVVFDEASQITVWDAIGAIARGKNAVIVGDPKQMPPTSFFDRSASGEDEDIFGVEDLESILDEALAASIKLHRLTGHYRSKHESLICFSNHRYYRGELVTYPSCETKDTAVHFRLVDALYARGKGRNNPDEAKAVVKEVIRRLNDPVLSKQSIGIVTLNSEQQKTIDDLLDQARRDNPELEQYFSDDYEEPVFVKNLETVQGDQRDIILLSVAYGPSEPGANTMSMNFGPLNRQGGERRLNVAITRATTEVIIFASFDPSMIDLTRTSAQAVRDLKHYMEFAQRGPAALGEAVQFVGGLDAFDSDFEEAVATGLRRKGWTVHTQIGVSKFRIDLGIVHPDFPGRYLAGVECDGATYHSSPSARDRDRIRHNILENLNWRLVRLWSTDYWIDPARALEHVHERLEELLEIDRAQQGADSSESDTESEESEDNFSEGVVEDSSPSESKSSENGASKSSSTSHIPDTHGFELSANQFYEDSYLETLGKFATFLVDKFGPITFIYLCTKIARAHGFARTGAQIRSQVRSAIEDRIRKTESPNGDVVYWPENYEPVSVFEFRGMSLNGEKRTWADVPYPEKLGLAREVAGKSSDPISAMVSKIGLGRLRQATKRELEKLVH
ncbi:MAG: DUF3320 domain-containing protein, partial [Bdellovibrionales bacterium]|nr:DUF3320 domain-containing protein [Bdellovibrionales bacterium]